MMNSQVDNMVTILVNAEMSANRLAVIESVERPNSEPPRHRHHWEDELLYIIEGEVTVLVDGSWQKAVAGTAVVIPRGAEHTFVVLSETARLLTVFTPAGFEGFYREMSHTTLPQGNGRNIEQWVATAARYGCEITGPHPGHPM
jgi:quercetin dioxygenase-like cupin family protein